MDSEVHSFKQNFKHYGYGNVGLSSSKSGKFRIFGKNLPLRDKAPKATFTKLGSGMVFQVRTLTQNFTAVALKNVSLQALKSPKLVIFCINLSQKYTP